MELAAPTAAALTYRRSHSAAPVAVALLLGFSAILAVAGYYNHGSDVIGRIFSICLSAAMAVLAFASLGWRESLVVAADRSTLTEVLTVFWPIYSRTRSLSLFNEVKLTKDVAVSEEDSVPYGLFTVKLIGPRTIFLVEQTRSYEAAKQLAQHLSDCLNFSLVEDCAYPISLPLMRKPERLPAIDEDGAPSASPPEDVPFAHDAVITLAAMDILAALAVVAGLSRSPVSVAVVAYFSIAALVFFFWSCRLVYIRPALPAVAQFLLGFNAVPVAILFVPLSFGVSVALVVGPAIDESYRKLWPYFTLGAAVSFLVLVMIASLLLGRFGVI
ncbi:MAG TPA: hypothetical protein VGP72_25755 [Planctomycetota bacterium]|jgi:hypothetical protein